MTDTRSNNLNHPGWGRVALSFTLAVTVVRVLVVYSTPLPLFFDEAQYWVWAQDLALGYYSKPPMIAWAIAATTAVCGDGAGCVRLSAPLFHGVTALVLFFLCRHFYDARTGFWATVTYSVLPGVTLSAVVVSTDVFLLFFWACALLVYTRADQSRDLRWWALLGLVLGLGLLSKYAMIFFIVCLFIDAVWRKSAPSLWRRPGFWTSLAVASIVYLPNFYWNWANDFPSYLHTGENINLGSDLFNPISGLEFIGSQFGVFGPILFGFLLLLVWRDFRQTSSRAALTDAQRRLYAFSLPVIVIMTVEALLSRSHANWAAVSYIAATILVVGELRRLDKSVWLKASLALHVSIAVAFYNFDLIARAFDLPITPGLDPARRLRGWDRAGDWAVEIRQDYPGVRLLFDDRKVMSEMLYYVQPHPLESVMWNPKGQRNNNFEMTTDLSGAAGENFLYLIKHDWPGRAGDSFAGSRHIATFRSRAFTGDVLELRAYLLEDFRGYQK